MKTALTLITFVASVSAQAQSVFPRVTPAEQTIRDDDRRLILEEEWQTEKKAVTAAENALAAAGPDADKESLLKAVQRHRKDLAALDAEIARTAGKVAESDRSKPVRLKAASAATVNPANSIQNAPYWDVYRRQDGWKNR